MYWWRVDVDMVDDGADKAYGNKADDFEEKVDSN